MRLFYLFIQYGRIGEIAHQFYCLRNLCEADKTPLTVISAGSGVFQSANSAVTKIVHRGLDLVCLQADDFSEAVQEYLAGVQEEYQLYPPFRSDKLRSEFMHRFVDQDPVYSFSLSEEEREQGRMVRKKMNVPLDADTITFHVRGPGYLKKFGDHFSYHDFRDATLDNYLPAIEYLVEKGFYIIRLGDKTMKRMPEHPQIIDAPYHPDYQPIVEPYFCSESKFHFGMASGPHDLALGFNTPLLCTNCYLSNGHLHGKQDLTVYKKYYSKGLQRFLTFEEIQLSHIPNFTSMAEFQENGIELVENSSEELRAAAREMVERLAGVYNKYGASRIRSRVRFIQEKSHHIRALVSPDFPFSADYLLHVGVSTEFFIMNPELLGVPLSSEELYKYHVKRQCSG